MSAGAELDALLLEAAAFWVNSMYGGHEVGLGISITLCLERLLGKDEKNCLKKKSFQRLLSSFLLVVTGLGRNFVL